MMLSAFSITRISVFVALLVTCSACAILTEDISEAKKLHASKNFQAAIDLLANHKSNRSRRYSSQVHLDYAVAKLSDLSVAKLDRYNSAQELFEESLRLDPKNSKARTYYLMILKTKRLEFPDA